MFVSLRTFYVTKVEFVIINNKYARVLLIGRNLLPHCNFGGTIVRYLPACFDRLNGIG